MRTRELYEKGMWIMIPNQETNWEKYRLSDFFHHPEGKKRYEKFPNTIIYEYYKKTSEQSNYKILCDVIDRVQSIRKIEIPKNDRCVVHLRTGDIIDNSEFTVDEFLSEKRYYQYNHDEGDYIKNEWNNYVKPMSYYATVAKKLKNIKVNDVSFSYNLNFNPFATSKRRKIYQRSNSTEKSSEYAQRIKDFFLEKSFNIVKYECKDIDYDFIYMCNSCFFVPSGGGLSKTVSKIVKLKGKTVVSNRLIP